MTVAHSQASTEQLIDVIVREVIAELARRGVAVGPPAPPVRGRERPVQHARPGSALTIDMSAYRTPVLTENHLTMIDPMVSTIIVPCNTVVTPGARLLLRSKNLTLERKVKSH